MNELTSAVRQALDAMHASRERRAFHVPGRIEVLGKHTDYAGGRSLLCAVERGFVVGVAPRNDDVVRIAKAESPDDVVEFRLDAKGHGQRTGWHRYAGAVVHRLARDFPDATRGADVAFASDLPQDSGLSSSSALVVGFFLALDAVNQYNHLPEFSDAIPRREALAEYLGAVENGRAYGPLEASGGVGTHGGCEDHTAILCCRERTLSRYSFCPVRPEGEVSMPPNRVFVIAFSGIAAAKAAGALEKYNEASLATEDIVRVWNEFRGSNDSTIGAAVGDDPGRAMEITGAVIMSKDRKRLMRRLRQFLIESNSIVPSAFDALQREDIPTFGMLVDESQMNVELLLGNQTAETIALARFARALGADAASAFGAGFGGSVWAMVRASDAEEFTKAWRARYTAEFPEAAEKAMFFTTGAGPGAHEIPLE